MLYVTNITLIYIVYFKFQYAKICCWATDVLNDFYTLSVCVDLIHKYNNRIKNKSASWQ